MNRVVNGIEGIRVVYAQSRTAWLAGGVLMNTLDASFSREVYLSEFDADHDLRFDYFRYSSTGTASHTLRYTDNNNRLNLEIGPSGLLLRQADGGVQSTLGTLSTTVAEDTWYQARVILNGGSVKVYWGTMGGTFNEIFSATTTELTTTRAAWLRAPANSEHGWDDIQLIAGTRSTVETFTYNDANEQLTHAKNGVTTTMTYDDWGRLEERDDGTHTATYAYRYGSKLYNVASDFPGEGNVTYETGGDGKRRSRIAGLDETWYNWGGELDVISEEADADGSSGALKRTYAGGLEGQIDGPIATSGVWKYYAHDNIGSTRGVWNQDKTMDGVLEYAAFGETFLASGNVFNITRRFASYSLDMSSGLYFTPFRYYSSKTNIWLRRDPIGMSDGPNLYSYVGGDPVSFSDPLGLSRVTKGGRKERKECKKKLDDTLGDLASLCACASRFSGKPVTGNIGLTPGPNTGFSPRQGHFRIPMSWCKLSDRDWYWYLAHEYGHAESGFSRLKYLLSRKFRKNEEAEADQFANECIAQYDAAQP